MTRNAGELYDFREKGIGDNVELLSHHLEARKGRI